MKRSFEWAHSLRKGDVPLSSRRNPSNRPSRLPLDLSLSLSLTFVLSLSFSHAIVRSHPVSVWLFALYPTLRARSSRLTSPLRARSVSPLQCRANVAECSRLYCRVFYFLRFLPTGLWTGRLFFSAILENISSRNEGMYFPRKEKFYRCKRRHFIDLNNREERLGKNFYARSKLQLETNVNR